MSLNQIEKLNFTNFNSVLRILDNSSIFVQTELQLLIIESI